MATGFLRDFAARAERRVQQLRSIRWKVVARWRRRSRRRVMEGGAPANPPIRRAPSGAELEARPLISFITPVYDTDPRWLRRAVKSVRAQAYPRWQLCICDDGSTNGATRQLLSELDGDSSIRIVRNESNSGISAASNRALELAEGEFVAFLDHDDELAPEALL
ncbi:MAG TPA: glycosyltransferase, partial [Gaiellaceae bacterium]|nr:glycosyltransferase [Gaiellaceae bacterium]